MDKAETFIKMSRKAKELQAGRLYQRDWDEGDFYYWSGDVDNVCGHCEMHGVCNVDGELSGVVWLPRQDQLQEMVRISSQSHNVLRLAHRFWFFVNRSPLISRAKYTPDWAKTIEQFTSMEQLWLAFVMQEKYGKIWNGEDWINA